MLRRLASPACAGSQLQTRTQGDIEASRCRDCGGIWLAKAEVEKILDVRAKQPKTDFALVAIDAGGEVGSGLGDFLSSFLD